MCSVVQFMQCVITRQVFPSSAGFSQDCPNRHSSAQNIASFWNFIVPCIYSTLLCWNLHTNTNTAMFIYWQSMPVGIVPMEMFVWWEVPISMRVEWRCASMTSGGQSVMTTGTAMMLLWSASSWVMLTLEVSSLLIWVWVYKLITIAVCIPTQMVKHIMVPTLVWAVGQFSSMMSTVPQGLTNC